MSANNPLHRPQSFWWWLKRPNYLLFMIREATAVFTGIYAALTLCMVRALHDGPEAYAKFLTALHCPWMVKLHVVALVFALIHTWTWFRLTPRVMVVQIGEHRVPPILMILGNWGLVFFVSAVISWIVVGR